MIIIGLVMINSIIDIKYLEICYILFDMVCIFCFLMYLLKFLKGDVKIIRIVKII